MQKPAQLLGRICAPALMVIALSCLASPAMAGNWPAPSPPAVAGSLGYVDIPKAALPRDPQHDYRAIFDAKVANPDPAKRSPQLLRLALQINGLVLAGVPREHINFAIILHGPAADAILSDTAYRRKHGAGNPNIALVDSLARMGVQIYVCGQHMARQDIPAADILPQARVAEAATLVMIRLQNDGFALIPDD